jgi:hypothetical protein
MCVFSKEIRRRGQGTAYTTFCFLTEWCVIMSAQTYISKPFPPHRITMYVYVKLYH